MSEPGLYESMSTLRAVRRLRPDPIPEEVLRRVIQAACWAPSGGNRQPWRIVAVRDPARKTRLQEIYAPLWERFEQGYRALLDGIRDVAEKDRQERMLAAAGHLASHLGEAPVILVFCFDPRQLAITDAALGRPSVVGGGSVYPAVENALLACRAEGLGCTLTTLHCQAEGEVKDLLGIPAEWGTCAYVPIGYPVLRGHGPIRRRPPAKMAYLDQWGDPLF